MANRRKGLNTKSDIKIAVLFFIITKTIFRSRKFISSEAMFYMVKLKGVRLLQLSCIETTSCSSETGKV